MTVFSLVVYKCWADDVVKIVMFCAQVFRSDALGPMGRCRSSGDPHVVTFDSVSYDIYTTGNFIYARSLAYVPVEVSFPLCDRSRLVYARYLLRANFLCLYIVF